MTPERFDALAYEDLVEMVGIWVATGRAPNPEKWGVEMGGAARSRGLAAL
ncbi:hypothetical protein AB1L88_15725 [Tautonia sp. JC769]